MRSPSCRQRRLSSAPRRRVALGVGIIFTSPISPRPTASRAARACCPASSASNLRRDGQAFLVGGKRAGDSPALSLRPPSRSSAMAMSRSHSVLPDPLERAAARWPGSSSIGGERAGRIARIALEVADLAEADLVSRAAALRRSGSALASIAANGQRLARARSRRGSNGDIALARARSPRSACAQSSAGGECSVVGGAAPPCCRLARASRRRGGSSPPRDSRIASLSVSPVSARRLRIAWLSSRIASAAAEVRPRQIGLGELVEHHRLAAQERRIVGIGFRSAARRSCAPGRESCRGSRP